MEAINVEELQWWAPPNVHRDPGIEFKTMFRGEDGKPDNYWFTLVQVREHYDAPRHRHNFDQVRFVLKGEFGFNEDQQQQAGTVGYFTEGTWYTQVGRGFSHTLLLQCENASRTPYVSTETFPAVAAELRKTGAFRNGRYVTTVDGKEVTKDGYEAVWEHITGRTLAYVEPRYEKPVIMDPGRYTPVPVAGEPGVTRKALGTFTERELAVSLFQLAAGATHRFDGARDGFCLAYVVSGEGRIGAAARPDTPWREGTGLKLAADDALDIVATSPAEIFVIAMPK